MLLEKYYNSIKVPILHYSDGCLVKNYDSENFTPNPASAFLASATKSGYDICYTISPEYIFYGFIKEKDTADCYIIGPCMTYECTRGQAQNILTHLNQPLSKTNDILRWFRSIPLCSLHRFFNILNYLHFLLSGEETIREVPKLPYFCDVPSRVYPDFTPVFIENFTDIIERQILSHIQYGNISELEATLSTLKSYSGAEPPSFSKEAIRSFKTTLTGATYLASRAAIKGGLDYNTANAITGDYILLIESLNNHADFFPMLSKMFLDFAYRSQERNRLISNSYLVTRINKNIQAHLYEKISPTLIAESLGMNCSYICNHFKQETGKTISEYINELKIQESKRLLENTDFSLIQISTQLGFSSQNYFHTLFKKIAGISPTEYRQQKK